MTHTANHCEESAIAVARRNATAPASLASDTPAQLPAPLPKAPLLEWSAWRKGGRVEAASPTICWTRIASASDRAGSSYLELRQSLEKPLNWQDPQQ